jgi:hypothetical protein
VVEGVGVFNEFVVGASNCKLYFAKNISILDVNQYIISTLPKAIDHTHHFYALTLTHTHQFVIKAKNFPFA